MKKTSLRIFLTLLLCSFFCFSGLKSFGQLTAGDFAIVGFNGNAATVNLAIAALKQIPSGTVLKITDRGWDQSALVANGSDGLITWTTTSDITAGTVFNISITGGAVPTATGLESAGTVTATGWTTGTVVAGGGDNWFLYTGDDSTPNFIYGFANWSTALPGTNAPDPTTGWQAAGTVSAAVSYLPSALAAGDFYIALTIAGTPPTGYHGDYNNYAGTFVGTKTSLLAAIKTKSNWVTTELLANKKSLSPGGAAFPGTNPIFKMGANVNSVMASNVNGAYKTGNVIDINVTFSGVVNVTGTPTLSLNTGGTANYTGGTGTTTLTFSYTVIAGHNTADLDYSATTALGVNGGTIKDATSTDATLTLPAPGAANSLGNNKNIVIDTTLPTISSVNSTSTNGTYIIGNTIPITINLSEAVTVTGTPTLSLNSGGTASYSSGSGSSALVFNYTIATGQDIADLDQASTSALSLNGGTIKDAAGNDATLTLAAPGATGSLGANKDLVINTTAPTILSINRVGSATTNSTSVDFVVTFSENVSGVDMSDFTITSTGITSPSVTAVSGSNTTRTVTVNTGTGDGMLRLDLKSTGTNIKNTIGNEIQGGYTAGQVYTINKSLLPLVATAGTVFNVSCNGGNNGSATVNVSGGTTPYTYSWAPSGGTAATATGLAAGTYTVTVTDNAMVTTTQSFTITEPIAPLSATTSVGAVSCNGGANGNATINATGGTAPYTYLWSNGATSKTIFGLQAGHYTYTVTDANGCSRSYNGAPSTPSGGAVVTQPSALSAASGGGSTNVSCFGGSNGTATVAPTGGTAPYTYSWSPAGGTAATASGLSSGSYTVTVTDANACQTTRTFVLSQPSAILAATTSVVTVSCNGGSNGSATINATGGTAPYTYLWSNGATTQTISGLMAGHYTYTVTDANGCSKAYNGALNSPTQGAVVTQPSALNTSISKVDVSCFGGSNGIAALSVSGGTGPYTYSWSPNVSSSAVAVGLTAGSYIVTATDNKGCTVQRTIVVGQPASAVSASITSQTNNSIFGGSTGAATVSATGGTPGYTYSWAPSGGTAATASGLTAGTYTVTIEDVRGCTTTQSVTITEPPALVLAAGTTVNILCNGSATGSATV
ncbi:SprB repeat-containing protein, partial [Pedobacter sp. Hv1]|uniref:beta strand repeat-containing protein n=1 Tax=Pedobacter sp. Hv1 TaxID=1740090 RepID=UPI00190FBFA9